MGEYGLNIPAISNRHSVWPRDLPVEHLLSLQPFISPEPIQYGTEGKFLLNHNLLENRITNLYLSKWITYVHASLKTFKILIYFHNYYLWINNYKLFKIIYKFKLDVEVNSLIKYVYLHDFILNLF